MTTAGSRSSNNGQGRKLENLASLDELTTIGTNYRYSVLCAHGCLNLPSTIANNGSS